MNQSVATTTHPAARMAAWTARMLVCSMAVAAALAEADENHAPFDLNDAKAIDAGRMQFAQTCVYCHGNEGSGGKAGPLKGRSDLTQDYLYATISNGKRAGAMVMPAWKESLDDNAIWTLVAYILSLQAKPDPVSSRGTE